MAVFDAMLDQKVIDGEVARGKSRKAIAKRVGEVLTVVGVGEGVGLGASVLATVALAWLGGTTEVKAAGVRELNSASGAQGVRYSEQVDGDHNLIIGGDGGDDGGKKRTKLGAGDASNMSLDNLDDNVGLSVELSERASLEDGKSMLSVEIGAHGVGEFWGLETIEEVATSGLDGSHKAVANAAAGAAMNEEIIPGGLVITYYGGGMAREVGGTSRMALPDSVLFPTEMSFVLLERVGGKMLVVGSVDENGRTVGIRGTDPSGQAFQVLELVQKDNALGINIVGNNNEIIDFQPIIEIDSESGGAIAKLPGSEESGDGSKRFLRVKLGSDVAISDVAVKKSDVLKSLTPTPNVPEEFTALGLDPAKYELSADKKWIMSKADGAIAMEKWGEEWVQPNELSKDTIDAVTAKFGNGFEVRGDMVMIGEIPTGLRAQEFEGQIVIMRQAEVTVTGVGGETKTIKFVDTGFLYDVPGEGRIPAFTINPETGALERVVLSVVDEGGEPVGTKAVKTRGEIIAEWAARSLMIRESLGLGVDDPMPAEYAPEMTSTNGLSQKWVDEFVKTDPLMSRIITIKGQNYRLLAVSKPDFVDKETGVKSEVKSQFTRLLLFKFKPNSKAIVGDVDTRGLACAITLDVNLQPVMDIVETEDTISNKDEFRAALYGGLPWIDPALGIELK